MSKVEREGGFIEDSMSGTDSVFTITVLGSHPMDQDMMDRTLQFVLMELGIDTTWSDTPPPTSEPAPAPVQSDTPEAPPA